ncbi:MAG: hypothetical protein ACOVQX_01775 [Legionella sp.]
MDLSIFNTQLDNSMKLLTQSEIELDELVAMPKDDAMDLEHQVRILQLVLQYRLDTQDILSKLMTIERSLLQLLGIEHLSSATVNLNNMAYVLGREDLQQALSALSMLMNMLLRIAQKYQKNQALLRTKAQVRQQKSYQPIINKLELGREKQKKILQILNDMARHLEILLQREPLGPVLNHIAALRGPISRFYQLVLSSFRKSGELSKQFNLREGLNKQLSSLGYSLDPQFSLFQREQPVSNLELRAEKRRLGHFFP